AAAMSPAPDVRDWMLALAPFGQARNLAAITMAAAARAPRYTEPEAAARHMLEVWRETRRRAGRRT
ncbi:MAG: hypothetical protein MI723_07615, partial [Caulobacterales bacterium]|nr:hypothetical protein [Caulobacterales bacterium]